MFFLNVTLYSLVDRYHCLGETTVSLIGVGEMGTAGFSETLVPIFQATRHPIASGDTGPGTIVPNWNSTSSLSM
jgi:hypothetical protein